VSPSLLSPSKKKSLEVTFDASLQGKPLTEVEALKSATQKSCNGSGSAKRDGKGRSNITRREDSMWRGELLYGFFMAEQACCLDDIHLCLAVEEHGSIYILISSHAKNPINIPY